LYRKNAVTSIRVMHSTNAVTPPIWKYSYIIKAVKIIHFANFPCINFA